MITGMGGTVPGTEITYRVEGEGPDLVLVHGLGGLFHSWRAFRPLLAATHRVWEIGLPAFDSDTTRARRGNSVEDWVSDLGRLIDHAQLERPVLIGNSMGGQVVATYAEAHPARVPAVVLLGSSGMGEQREGYSLFPEGAVRRLVKSIEEDVMRTILRTVFADDRFFETELSDIRTHLSDRRWKLGLLTTARRVRDATLLPLLPRLQQPTLMVYGDLDRIVPIRFARAAAPLLPHGELVELPATGHAPQIERPTETHDRVLGFLRPLGL